MITQPPTPLCGPAADMKVVYSPPAALFPRRAVFRKRR